MFGREIKINFKNFIIWTSILIGMFLVVFLIYPSLVAEENIDSINEMMKIFPEDVLRAFNMDISNIDSAFGWLKTEGFVFVLLITGIYSSILGSNILLKEESDKTIEYLNSLPVTRKAIVISKIKTAVIYIISMVAVLGIFNFISLCISGDFDKKLYLMLCITPIFSSLVFFAICLFISTFTHKTRKVFGVSLAIVFLSYFLQIISEMSENVRFFKYLSIFTLADIRNVIVDKTINPILVIISLTLTVLFMGLTMMRYEKKELV